MVCMGGYSHLPEVCVWFVCVVIVLSLRCVCVVCVCGYSPLPEGCVCVCGLCVWL